MSYLSGFTIRNASAFITMLPMARFVVNDYQSIHLQLLSKPLPRHPDCMPTIAGVGQALVRRMSSVDLLAPIWYRCQNKALGERVWAWKTRMMARNLRTSILPTLKRLRMKLLILDLSSIRRFHSIFARSMRF